jgi:hypothetical protein
MLLTVFFHFLGLAHSSPSARQAHKEKSTMQRKLFLLAAILAFSICPARAQDYTDAYLNSVNFNTVYPCGNQGTPTQQMQQALISVVNHSGGTIDMTCYQTAVAIASDLFTAITVPVTLILPQHTVTVNANSTIGSNFFIPCASGGSIVAGAGKTLTNNSLGGCANLTNFFQCTLFYAGVLATGTGANGPDYLFPAAYTPRSMFAVVKSAPTGSAITIVVTVNGVAYGSTLTIAAGALRSNTASPSTSVNQDDKLNYNITSVGSSYPGEDMTLVVR